MDGCCCFTKKVAKEPASFAEWSAGLPERRAKLERQVRLGLVVVGIILLIAGGITTGCTYSKLGPNSLYIVGAAFVVSLFLIIKSTRCIDGCCRKRTRVATLENGPEVTFIASSVHNTKNTGPQIRLPIQTVAKNSDPEIRQKLENIGIEIDEDGEMCTLPAEWTVKWRPYKYDDKETGYDQLILNEEGLEVCYIQFINKDSMFIYVYEPKDFDPEGWQDEFHPNRLGLWVR